MNPVACSAKYSNGEWYDAEVTSENGDGTLRVTFIDDGISIDDLSANDVRSKSGGPLQLAPLAMPHMSGAVEPDYGAFGGPLGGGGGFGGRGLSSGGAKGGMEEPVNELDFLHNKYDQKYKKSGGGGGYSGGGSGSSTNPPKMSGGRKSMNESLTSLKASGPRMGRRASQDKGPSLILILMRHLTESP